MNLSKILSSHDYPLISESGIYSIEDMKFLIQKTQLKNFLIGESLLASDDVGSKLKEFAQISV